MDMVALTSGCTITTHLRDASFSSYLNCSEEEFLCKLADSSVVDHNPNITDSFHFGRKKEKDGEIGVFGAEKYFNEGRDEDSPAVFKNIETNCNFAKDGGVYAVPTKVSSQPRAASVCSEPASWNSQSALLKNVPRKPPHHKRRSKSLLTSIRCINCSCNASKSVDIDEKNSKTSINSGGFEGKETTKNGMDSNTSVSINRAELNPWIMKQIQSRRIDETGRGLSIEDGFSFPVVDSKPGNFTLRLEGRENEKTKKSLEMLGSSTSERKKHSLKLDRRTAMLPWNNPTAGLEELENGMHNDTGSDVSSDLFEIDGFKNNVKDLSLARNASYDMFSYAPSEASIEWSVVTASAADFEDQLPEAAATARSYRMSSNGKHGVGKEMEKRRSGILSGCKSQKAVLVAGDAYRMNGKAFPDPGMRCRPDSFERATRFQTEGRRTSFDSRSRP